MKTSLSVWATGALWLVLAASAADSVGQSRALKTPMVFPHEDWVQASPESQGIDPAKLRAAIDYLARSLAEHGGAGTVFIVRNGHAIWQGPDCDREFQIFSATKSFTSTVLGLLIDDGKVTLNTLAKEFEPALAGQYSGVTLRHFATMTSGYDSAGGSYEFDAPAADEGPRPSPKPQAVRVAGIVLKWLRGDKEANYRRIEPLIREAAAHGAQIVCTTEGFLDGYAIADKSIPLEQYRALGEPIPQGEHFRKLAGLAKELKIFLIAGMLEADGEQRFNTAALIGPSGELIGKYHKQQLEHEAVRNTAGNQSSVFDTPLGKIGVMICADRRFQDVVKGFCERGADFLICPSGGMFGPKRNDHILQARSKENRKYIVFVHPAEFLVTGPDGTILERTILGDRLLIAPDQIGTAVDSQRVFYFDVPLTHLVSTSTLSVPAAQGPR